MVTQKEKENLMKVIGSTAPTVKPEEKPAPRAGNSGVSSNAYAQGSRQNVGNVITDRPTSRVTQPPGGRSSISFYWAWWMECIIYLQVVQVKFEKIETIEHLIPGI